METIFLLTLSLLFSIAAVTCYLDRKPMTSLLMSFTAVSIVCSVAIAGQHVRLVGAEDDCAMNTYNVTRLPVIGLVCIGEPS